MVFYFVHAWSSVSFILFKKVSVTVKEVCIHIMQFKMISKKNCLFLSKCLLELHVGFNETIEFSTWSVLVTCWLCNALTLSQRDLYFFLRWQLVFHDPETDQLQKKNKLLHKLALCYRIGNLLCIDTMKSICVQHCLCN